MQRCTSPRCYTGATGYENGFGIRPWKAYGWLVVGLAVAIARNMVERRLDARAAEKQRAKDEEARRLWREEEKRTRDEELAAKRRGDDAEARRFEYAQRKHARDEAARRSAKAIPKTRSQLGKE
jgi:flagellar biosynthesis/type III secretory pathway M-ring protein FliF/YscJ